MSCRLLYLVGQLGPGGLQRQLYYLLSTMDRQRYQPAVAVWSYVEQDVYVSELKDLGIPMYPMPQETSRVQKLQALRNLVSELKPEVFHSYSFYTNFAASWASMGLEVIPVGSIRNDFVFERQEMGAIIGRLSARWPRYQICNSDAAMQSVKSYKSVFKPGSNTVVRNGLDVQQYGVVAELPSSLSVVAVGRLHPEKRWDRLLRTVKMWNPQAPDVIVTLAGDGPLRESLAMQAQQLGIEKNIRFLGHSPHVPQLLANSSFLIHTADHEGCPNIIMEAMACGRAVVATDVGDVSHLVEDGVTGFVVPKTQEALLAKRALRLMQDPDLCERMGGNARQKAERDFNLQSLVQNTFSAYQAEGWSA